MRRGRTRPSRALAVPLAAALLGAGAGPASGQEAGGDFAVRVQYPPAGATVAATDSTFVFGRVDGVDPAEVALTVNGRPVEVHPSGGWLAFVPIEPGPFAFRIRAVADGREASVDHPVVVPPPLHAPGPDTLPYKPETIEPAGELELYAGDTLRVSVVAAPGIEVRARLGFRSEPLVPRPVRGSAAGRLAFGRATPPADAAPSEGDWLRYSGDVFLLFAGGVQDTLFLEFSAPDGRRTVVPAATVRYLDPTVVGVAVLDDDTAGSGTTDGRVIARTGPGQGYELFLPNGTTAATARLVGGYRQIALGPGSTAWVPVGEAFPAPGPRPRDAIPVVRLRAADGWSEIVLPTAERLPFAIEQRLDPVRYTVRVYGLTSNIDWIRGPSDDPLVRSIAWREETDGVLELDVRLAGRTAWGWRVGWEGTHLVIGFRRPPPALADRRFRSALHGVRIVVDPGHEPGAGAIGPAGLEERDVNLAISLELARILERRGADVVLTRAAPGEEVGLYERTNLAVEAGAEVFVSIHNNALPDGVDPFANNGTSTFWYHPQSEPLAEAVQRELLPRTGLPDYGVGYGNLAVLRMNEMPAVLVEGAFMMIPEQEASLRTVEFRRRIAEGVAAGIERFLAESRGGR